MLPLLTEDALREFRSIIFVYVLIGFIFGTFCPTLAWEGFSSSFLVSNFSVGIILIRLFDEVSCSFLCISCEDISEFCLLLYIPFFRFYFASVEGDFVSMVPSMEDARLLLNCALPSFAAVNVFAQSNFALFLHKFQIKVIHGTICLTQAFSFQISLFDSSCRIARSQCQLSRLARCRLRFRLTWKRFSRLNSQPWCGTNKFQFSYRY